MARRLPRVTSLAARVLLAAALGFAVACDPPPDQPAGTASPPAPAAAPAPPAAAPTRAPAARASYDLGPFALAPDPVVDGDTLRLADPRENVRVHGVDAEEVFHDAKKRAAAEKDFAEYARAERGDERFPRKYGTPAGEAAKAFAKAFFAGVSRVRLETDEEGRERDGFGRRLAHVLVEKDGLDVLYAEELVRAGLAPYYVKYGRSERYDARLRAAQTSAREARRGIWGDAVAHYPDYEERLVWWEARAKQVDAWLAEVRGKPGTEDRIRLGVPAETARLPALLGRRVTLFGSLDHVVGAAPRRLLLVDAPRAPFEVVVFDEAVWRAIDLSAVESRFVRVSGKVSEFRGRLQVTLAAAEDLSTK